MEQLSLSAIIESIYSGDRRNNHCRIIAIDGPAGAGKSTLATRIQNGVDNSKVAVVHMDDLYAGWENALTSTLTRTLENNIAAPAFEGKAFEYRKYDWIHNRFGEYRRIDVPDLLILEGVGAGQKAAVKKSVKKMGKKK